uniref:Uncharacterized protein n=1 Tax=Tanacetum cinerariifolium TaxID=118510 RepID=A0A6L2NGD4_TANCI|nr:hypothetical protein [Tanacetum cinerariifolium]
MNSEVQTSGSGISNLLAVATTFTGSGNLYCRWELYPGSGNALCILFPTQSGIPDNLECEDNEATLRISVNKDYALCKRMQMLLEKEIVVKAYTRENDKTNSKDGNRTSYESEMCHEAISQSSLHNTLTEFFNGQAFVPDLITKIPIIDQSSLVALETKKDVIVLDVASLRKNLMSLIKSLAKLVQLLSTSGSKSASVPKSAPLVIESFGQVTAARKKEPKIRFKPILYNIKGTRISILSSPKPTEPTSPSSLIVF